jgi:hypothetical protein
VPAAGPRRRACGWRGFSAFGSLRPPCPCGRRGPSAGVARPAVGPVRACGRFGLRAPLPYSPLGRRRASAVWSVQPAQLSGCGPVRVVFGWPIRVVGEPAALRPIEFGGCGSPIRVTSPEFPRTRHASQVTVGQVLRRAGGTTGCGALLEGGSAQAAEVEGLTNGTRVPAPKNPSETPTRHGVQGVDDGGLRTRNARVPPFT